MLDRVLVGNINFSRALIEILEPENVLEIENKVLFSEERCFLPLVVQDGERVVCRRKRRPIFCRFRVIGFETIREDYYRVKRKVKRYLSIPLPFSLRENRGFIVPAEENRFLFIEQEGNWRVKPFGVYGTFECSRRPRKSSLIEAPEGVVEVQELDVSKFIFLKKHLGSETAVAQLMLDLEDKKRKEGAEFFEYLLCSDVEHSYSAIETLGYSLLEEYPYFLQLFKYISRDKSCTLGNVGINILKMMLWVENEAVKVINDLLFRLEVTTFGRENPTIQDVKVDVLYHFLNGISLKDIVTRSSLPEVQHFLKKISQEEEFRFMLRESIQLKDVEYCSINDFFNSVVPLTS